MRGTRKNRWRWKEVKEEGGGGGGELGEEEEEEEEGEGEKGLDEADKETKREQSEECTREDASRWLG